MAISLKHAFTSGKAASADGTLVDGPKWDAEHDLTLTALSVLGRPDGLGGAAEEITAGLDGQVLRRSGTNLEFGALDIESPNAITGVLPLSNLDANLAAIAGGVFPGGLQVGFSGTPTADKIEIGDVSFHLDLAVTDANTATILFDTGDSYRFNRTTNEHIWRIGGNARLRLSNTVLDTQNNDVVSLGQAGVGFSDLYLAAGGIVFVNSVQVLTTRQTGWTAATGTAQRSGYATYTSPNISPAYTEAEVQAIADALQNVSRTLKAVVDDLIAHGLIGT